jgi:hypothetical protein
MCHEKWRRVEERDQERRGEGLWDLFYRETERPAPPTPVAERERATDREEALAAARGPANDER